MWNGEKKGEYCEYKPIQIQHLSRKKVGFKVIKNYFVTYPSNN